MAEGNEQQAGAPLLCGVCTREIDEDVAYIEGNRMNTAEFCLPSAIAAPGRCRASRLPDFLLLGCCHTSSDLLACSYVGVLQWWWRS